MALENNKKNISLIVRAVLTCGLIGLFVYLIDIESVGQMLRRTELAPMAAAAAIRLLLLWITAIRWWRILEFLGAKVPFGFASLAMYEAITVNLLLPGSVGGDVLRAWRAGKWTGGLRKPIFSVLLDRALTLFVLVFGTCSLIVLIPDTVLAEKTMGGSIAFVLITLLFGGAIVVFQARLLRLWPLSVRSRPTRELRQALANFLRIFLRQGPAVEVLALSALIVAGNGAILWLCFLALNLEPAAPPVLLLAVTLGALGSAVPISIAGIGLREGTMVGAMIFSGMAPIDAIATSLLWTVIVFVEAIPGLVVFAVRPIGRSMQPIPSSDPVKHSHQQNRF